MRSLDGCPPLYRRFALWTLLALCWPSVGRAVVVAPAPGEHVTLLREQVLLVFDPLTATQTIVTQHEFAGTATPFGLIIPTQGQAKVSVASERLQRAIRSRLHPEGKIQRSLDLRLVSWLGGCAVREVGDGPTAAESTGRPPMAAAEPTLLGSAPEPLHDWLISNGFTVSPAQAAWLARLRAQGWHLTAVVVNPRQKGLAPPPVVRGPVLALSHPADGPAYAAAHPPFALPKPGAGWGGPPLEVAVLTEWAVTPDVQPEPAPFFADSLSGQEVSRIGNEAAGLPWAFRRDGTLTAYEIARPGGLGVVRFGRSDPHPSVRPEPEPRLRAYRLRVPIELLMLAGLLVAWIWWRYGRRRAPQGRLR
ncbi:MAG: DUF2330 domain-containing protein [Myxococcales bacterium]|nr:DUF2330 domain-containing protein [Myxococcales bacterium]